MPDARGSAAARGSGPLEALLGLFTEVRAGEAATASLLTLDLACITAAGFLLRTAREPLLVFHGGWSTERDTGLVLGALLSLPAYLGYTALTRWCGRLRLAVVLHLLLTLGLGAIAALGPAGITAGGVIVSAMGLIGVLAMLHFWSFASDVYPIEAGKRLFAVVLAGGALGALAAMRVARPLFAASGARGVLLCAAGLLLVSLVLTAAVHARSASPKDPARSAPPGRIGGFRLIAGDRYLLLLAVAVAIRQAVVTTGEYLGDRALVEGRGAALAPALTEGEVNMIALAGGLALQLLLVSRFLKHAGVRAALLVLPLLLLGGYAAIALSPALPLLLYPYGRAGAGAVEGSIDRTVEQVLYLPASREAKYNARAAAELLFGPAGVLLSGGIVALGFRLHLSTGQLAWCNVALVAGWIAVALALGRRFHELSRAEADPPA
jgi:AAA family ATP:ADP antiporter